MAANKNGNYRKFDESKALILEKLGETPQTLKELANTLGMSRAESVARLTNKIEEIKIVDWRYIGRALVAVYGVSENEVTRTEWFIKNNIPATRQERKSKAARSGAPWSQIDAIEPKIPLEIRRKLNHYGIPEQVRKSFRNGASVVMFEGKKYVSELVPC